MATTTVTVSGMTCDHCVRAVHDEVARIRGVTDVTVDLASGRVTIESTTDLDAAALAAAIDEAGYELAEATA